MSGMNVIRLTSWGGTKVNRASSTAGATFQSLMTVVTLSRRGCRVGDDILVRQRLVAVGDPDLKVHPRAAEDQMIAPDPTDDGLADHHR